MAQYNVHDDAHAAVHFMFKKENSHRVILSIWELLNAEMWNGA
jgi:hypothetical protein